MLSIQELRLQNQKLQANHYILEDRVTSLEAEIKESEVELQNVQKEYQKFVSLGTLSLKQFFVLVRDSRKHFRELQSELRETLEKLNHSEFALQQAQIHYDQEWAVMRDTNFFDSLVRDSKSPMTRFGIKYHKDLNVASLNIRTPGSDDAIVRLIDTDNIKETIMGLQDALEKVESGKLPLD